MKSRILLADDHKMVAEGLANLLESDYEIVGIATNGLELLEAAEKYSPDVIITDISMPLINGIEAARQIRKRDEQVKIVFLTMHVEASYVEKALAAGASGFLLKHSASTELLTALQEIFAGRLYVSPMIESSLVYCDQQGSQLRNEALAKLSSRQRQVLQLLAEGNSAKDAGETLYISARTVEFHKYNVMKILDLKCSTELVKFSIKYGIIAPE